MPVIDREANPVHVTEYHGYELPEPPVRFVPRYDGYNRYVLPHPDTGRMTSFTRVTTVASVLDDTFGLDRWKRRNIVQGLATSAAMIAETQAYIDAIANGDQIKPKAFDDIAMRAEIAAGAADAREFGQAVHAWLQAIDEGRIVVAAVPERFRPHVVQYLTRLALHAVTAMPQYCERIVIRRHARETLVGTIDRIYRQADGSLVCGDLKTSTTLEYSYLDFAIQTTCYRDADAMLSLDGQRWEPMPPLGEDYTLVLHCPSNAPERTAAIPFDVGIGRQGLDLALLVRSLRSTAKTKVPNSHDLPIPSAHHARQHEAVLAIRLATEASHVAAAWEEYQDVWIDGLTELGRVQLDLLSRQLPRGNP